MLLPSTSLNKLQPGKRSGSRSTHPAMAAARPMNGELPVSLPEVLPPATSSDHLSMLLPGTSPNKLQPEWTEIWRPYFGRVEVTEERCDESKVMEIRFGMCGASRN
nr:uncharacterized protein LOC127348380 isoform X2 [Lolium perenne]